MRLLPIVLMLAATSPLAAQTTKPQHWIGTLEFQAFDGLNIGRITADLSVDTTSRTISGDWRSRGGASGSIKGTVDDKGRIKAAVTIFGGGASVDENGKPIVVATERCRGEGQLEGAIHAGGEIVRLTTTRLRLDTPQLRAQGKHCEDMTRVVMLLQFAEH